MYILYWIWYGFVSKWGITYFWHLGENDGLNPFGWNRIPKLERTGNPKIWKPQSDWKIFNTLRWKTVETWIDNDCHLHFTYFHINLPLIPWSFWAFSHRFQGKAHFQYISERFSMWFFPWNRVLHKQAKSHLWWFSSCSSTFETTTDHLSILLAGSIGIFHPEKSGDFEIVNRQLYNPTNRLPSVIPVMSSYSGPTGRTGELPSVSLHRTPSPSGDGMSWQM